MRNTPKIEELRKRLENCGTTENIDRHQALKSLELVV